MFRRARGTKHHTRNRDDHLPRPHQPRHSDADGRQPGRVTAGDRDPDTPHPGRPAGGGAGEPARCPRAGPHPDCGELGPVRGFAADPDLRAAARRGRVSGVNLNDLPGIGREQAGQGTPPTGPPPGPRDPRTCRHSPRPGLYVLCRHCDYADVGLRSQLPGGDWAEKVGVIKRKYFDAYVMIDIYSCYIVGAKVHPAESAVLATEMMTETFSIHGTLQVVHADRGTSMTSKTVAALLSDLEVTKSHSRPRRCPTHPGLRRQTHQRGQRREGDHALPQALRRPRNIPRPAKPTARPANQRPASTAPRIAPHPDRSSTRAERLAQSHLAD
ncbi:transposase [Cryobacterium sp. TmT2-59]|nr:transposase [Cryobacterium sp. TmT2-59]